MIAAVWHLMPWWAWLLLLGVVAMFVTAARDADREYRENRK